LSFERFILYELLNLSQILLENDYDKRKIVFLRLMGAGGTGYEDLIDRGA
jgi:hypothetical protein